MAKTNTAEGMSKMDAVRRALKELGKDAKPLQLQPYIKETLGIDMSVDHVSTYKSLILRRAKKGKKKAAVAANASANGSNAPAAKSVPAAKPRASSISEQVAMLKAASAALGKEEAKRIIDLF